MRLLDKIKIEDLHQEQKEIAELIGLEAYKLLVQKFGGGNIYIQKEDTLTKELLREQIVHDFNGLNYRELALKYNVSIRTVRRITDQTLKSNMYTKKNQIGFF